MFDAYRSTMADHGLPGGAGMAFMPLVYTADSEEEAEKGAKELTWYMRTKNAARNSAIRPATSASKST